MISVFKARVENNMRVLVLVLTILSLTLTCLLSTSASAAVTPNSIQHADGVSLNLTGESIVNVTLSAVPESLRLSGSTHGGADVVVYLLSADKKLLVLNGSDLTEVPPLLDDDISDAVKLINTSTDASDEVTTRLDYGMGKNWDANNDGREYYYSAIDFLVANSSFNFASSADKTCTLWQVYSMYSGKLTTVCYGSPSCCLIYNIAAIPETRWNDTFFLQYGKMNAGEKNVVGARVVYADIDLNAEKPTYTVYRGNWDFKSALFYEPKFEFKGACDQTCDDIPVFQSILLEVDAADYTKVSLESIGYSSAGLQNTSFLSVGINNLAVSVTDKNGAPIGSYKAASSDGQKVTLNISSKPLTAQAGLTVSTISEAESHPPLDNPTTYVTEQASDGSYTGAVISGLRDTPGGINAVIDDAADEGQVVTQVLALPAGLVFDNMSVSLAERGKVTLIVECPEFNYTLFQCPVWQPLTSDFADSHDRVSFNPGHSGVYAGLNVSVLDYFLDMSEKPTHERAVVGSRVPWEMHINTRYSEQMSFNVLISAPPYAENVTVTDNKTGEQLELTDLTESPESEKHYETRFLGGRNYTMEYTLPGPTKSENVGSSDGLWSKNISISSVRDYGDVMVYSSLDNAPTPTVRLIEYGGGYLNDVTDNPSYNITLVDSGSDGGSDWVYFKTPSKDNRTFMITSDSRQIEQSSSNEYARSVLNPDGMFTSYVTLASANYLRNLTWVGIDNTIKLLPQESSDYSLGAQDYSVNFSSDSLKPMRFTANLVYALSSPKDANVVQALSSGNTLAYYGAWNGTDLLYVVSPKSVTEKIIIRNPDAPTDYELILSSDKATISKDQGGYGFYDKNSVRAFGFTIPYAYDAAGRRVQAKDNLVRKSKEYQHTISVDEAFLKDAEYPITLELTWSAGASSTTLDGYTDGSQAVTSASYILVGNSTLAPNRGFMEFNISAIPDNATVTSVKLHFNVETPMSGCTECALLVNRMGSTPQEHLDNADQTGLWADAGNISGYGSIGSCDISGGKTIDLGALGLKELKVRTASDVLPIGLTSADERSTTEWVSITSARDAGAKTPYLEVVWTNVTTTTLPQLTLTSVDDLVGNPRCPYDSAAMQYDCNADDIIVNGVVDLLHEGENSSRSIRFTTAGVYNITSDGIVKARGRDIIWSHGYAIDRAEGGTVTVNAYKVTIEGSIDTSGGSASSTLYPLNGGDGGNIILHANDSILVSGTLNAQGGAVNTQSGEGGSGGQGGTITITSDDSWVTVNVAHADSGDSNTLSGKKAGTINIQANDYVNVTQLIVTGGYSRYDNGAPGSDVTIQAKNLIITGQINVSGGSSSASEGGSGGTVTLTSQTNDVTVEGGLTARSGSSDDSINQKAGSVLIMAHNGTASILSTLDASGGVDAAGGVGGDGGTVKIEAHNVTVAKTISAIGGSSAKSSGSGGEGGSVNIEYCGVLNGPTTISDVKGGVAGSISATSGASTVTYTPAWCGGIQATPPCKELTDFQPYQENADSAYTINGIPSSPKDPALTQTDTLEQTARLDGQLWTTNTSQLYEFKVTLDPTQLPQLNITWAGETSIDGKQVNIILYNWGRQRWDSIASVNPANAGPKEAHAGVSENVSEYVEPTTKTVAVLLTSNLLSTDYITLTVNPQVSYYVKQPTALGAYSLYKADGALLGQYTCDNTLHIVKDGTDDKVVEFTITENADLMTVKVDSSAGKVAVDFRNATGVDPEHTLYIPNLYDSGAYICPHAKTTDDVTLRCSGKVTFTHIDCQNNVTKSGMTCTIVGSDYKVSGIPGSGGGSNPPNRAPSAVLNSPTHLSLAPETYRLLNATVGDVDNNTLTVWLYAGNRSDDITRLVYYNPVTMNNTEIDYNLTALPISSTYDSSIVLLYHLDNDSRYGENNGFVYDHGLMGHNCTPQPGAQPTINGKFAGGYAFNGTDGYIDCGAYNLSGAQATISAWIKPYSFQTISVIAGMEDTPLASTLLLRLGDSGLANNKPQFVLYQDNQLKLNASTGLEADKWYLITGTYDGSDMRLYINGVEDASTPLSGDYKANSTFNIGGDLAGTGTFNGTIDDVTVRNRSLTAAEVLDLYRLRNGSYYWYANVSDGDLSTNTTAWKFTVGQVAGNNAPTFGYKIYQLTENASKDTYIQDTAVVPGVNSNSTNLTTGRESGVKYRSLLYFNITTVPTEANLTASALGMYLHAGTYGVQETPYNVTSGWDETYANWTYRTQTQTWTTPGGDYS